MADKPIIEINRNTEGQLDGLCKFYFHRNFGGKLNWQAHFKEGKLHGQSCYFCKDKKNSEQYFEYGKPVDKWKYWDEKGKLIIEKIYENYELKKSVYYFDENSHFTAYWKNGAINKIEYIGVENKKNLKNDPKPDITYDRKNKALFISWLNTNIKLNKWKYRKTEYLHIKNSSNLFDISQLLNRLPRLKKIKIHNSIIHFLPKEIGKLKDLEELEIWGPTFIGLPEEIGNLSKLKILDLSNSKILCLPESIGNLYNLQILKLEETWIEELPISIGNLKNLKELIAGSKRFQTKQYLGKIRELPSELSKCTNLSTLKLTGNRIFTIPIELFKMQYTDLIIGSNNLIELPNEINQLENLTNLNLSDNYLLKMPELSDLTKLKILNLSMNLFQDFPIIKNNIQLTDLNLAYNEITSIPGSLIYQKELKYFRIDKNPIRKIGKEILAKRSGVVVRTLKPFIKSLKSITKRSDLGTIICASENDIINKVPKDDPRSEVVSIIGKTLFNFNSADIFGGEDAYPFELFIPKKNNNSITDFLFDKEILEIIDEKELVRNWVQEEKDEEHVDKLLTKLKNIALEVEYINVKYCILDDCSFSLEFQFIVAKISEDEYLGIIPDVKIKEKRDQKKITDLQDHTPSEKTTVLINELKPYLNEINALYNNIDCETLASKLVHIIAKRRDKIIEKLILWSIATCVEYNENYYDVDHFKPINDVLFDKMMNLRVYKIGLTQHWHEILFAETNQGNSLGIVTQVVYT